MKTKLITLLFCLSSVGSVYAGVNHAQPISMYQAEQIATNAAYKLALQNPSLKSSQLKQEIFSKFEKPIADGACCEAWYYGKQVQGGMIAAHGHAVCVPHLSCEGKVSLE